jgi:cholinesterase
MKKIWNSFRIAVLSAAVCMVPGVALASNTPEPPSELIIISGSLSDVGNYFAVNGSFGFPFADNRSTNGKNLDDYFAEIMNFENKSSLHLIGPVQGNNFAVFQSLARGNGPNDLPAQISAYLNSRGGNADSDALHLFLISGSDVIDALLQPSDTVASQIIDATVKGQEEGLWRLINAGAEKIYAPSFTDLGYSPYSIKNNVVRRATRISEEYDRKYNAMLDRLDRKLIRQNRHNVEVIRWDFFGYTRRLIRRAHEFGFTNLTESCIDALPSGRCDFDKYFFLSDFFPTTRTHRMFAIAMAQNLIDSDRCRKHLGKYDGRGNCHSKVNGAPIYLSQH